MKAFADLYTALDETNKTNAKVALMANYFQDAPPEDAAWVLHFLSGRRPRRAVNGRKLAEWAAAEAGVPDWLFGESYDAVGDIAETITLLLPETDQESDLPLHEWVEERLLPLQDLAEGEQRQAIVQAWQELSRPQRFIWNKLITGGFRVGVSQKLVVRALADVSGIDTAALSHRLMGQWDPTPQFYEELLHPATEDTDISRPYPFFLAYPIENDPATELGDIAAWQVEWKWDGIRAQLIRRQDEIFLWTRGEELVTDRYPEVTGEAEKLPNGTVLDGELLPWQDGQVLPFAQLQRRIGRKTVGKKLLAEVPVIFLAYDLIEVNGVDWRGRPLHERRTQLIELINQLKSDTLLLSPIAEANSWESLTALRAESRARMVEGFMLKRIDSPYRVGRQRGDWWKWKVDPYTVDAVLIYAQRGSGKRASLYTDYTFGVWDDEGTLVPFAKAYSGLTDEEIRQVDRFVRANTKEKFGPVRTVTPELVFELAFEAIQRSNRHKSGIAVRFPRILRWRHDKKIEEADTLATIQAMLPDG
ncbi:MAG TPA: ATP-dependent DNA ligase [Caldilineaceae bacterium]|nr:ATP-dependent DNA ligase [Caldilineaceae bacterium]